MLSDIVAHSFLAFYSLRLIDFDTFLPLKLSFGKMQCSKFNGSEGVYVWVHVKEGNGVSCCWYWFLICKILPLFLQVSIRVYVKE